jgi:hypothetical protein
MAHDCMGHSELYSLLVSCALYSPISRGGANSDILSSSQLLSPNILASQPPIQFLVGRGYGEGPVDAGAAGDSLNLDSHMKLTHSIRSFGSCLTPREKVSIFVSQLRLPD